MSARTETPPTAIAEIFKYVDTTVGGVSHRNNIKTAGALSPNGIPGVYQSWQRATDALSTWVTTHRNKDGNPTVAGFDGPTWSPTLNLDFDHESDPSVSLGWLRRVLHRLEGWGVDLRSLSIAWSGNKGFSLLIQSVLFGGFEPSASFHRQAKRAAELILQDIPFDGSIYDKLRLWRVINSQHEKSGLYKVPLSPHEALTLSIDEIRVLAAQPRLITEHLTPLPDDELEPIPELVEIWLEAIETAGSGAKYEATEIADDERDRQTVLAIVAAWERCTNGLSRHTDLLTPLAGFLTGHMRTDHAKGLLCQAARESSDASFLNGRDWESEIERLVDGSAQRRASDQPFKGLPALSSEFPALAKVLGVLWPGPEFDLGAVGQTGETTGETGDNGAAPAAATPRRYVETPWPAPLAEEAFHGLVGDIVRAVEPYSEADPAALLAHALSGLGALVHKHVRAIAGDAEHPARLNTVCVGETAKGRKGSSFRPVQRIVRAADPEFDRHIAEGLSSGEGLIWQVRDAIFKWEKRKNQEAEYVEVDPGEADKRLWIVESEFASVLRMIQREGNTLSAVVRRAWDAGDLNTLTKNSPAKATGAHIVITGHVTKDELLRYLDRSELASGFANRFLWFAVSRGSLLPDGGEVPSDVIADLAARAREVWQWANTARVIGRDDEASVLWREVYPALSDGHPGMLGAATNRAEAQVLRLSVLYAVLDRSTLIRAEHLLAALAVWRYAEASARWIFGDATGDPVADSILTALRGGGDMSRNDIVNFFGRNLGQSRLDKALGLLLRAGLVRFERVPGENGGRPKEVWSAT